MQIALRYFGVWFRFDGDVWRCDSMDPTYASFVTMLNDLTSGLCPGPADGDPSSYIVAKICEKHPPEERLDDPNRPRDDEVVPRRTNATETIDCPTKRAERARQRPTGPEPHPCYGGA